MHSQLQDMTAVLCHGCLEALCAANLCLQDSLSAYQACRELQTTYSFQGSPFCSLHEGHVPHDCNCGLEEDTVRNNALYAGGKDRKEAP